MRDERREGWPVINCPAQDETKESNYNGGGMTRITGRQRRRTPRYTGTTKRARCRWELKASCKRRFATPLQRENNQNILVPVGYQRNGMNQVVWFKTLTVE